MVAAADADRGPQALRTTAVIRLLLHNALRVDEACAADMADLGADAGHRVLRVTRKGARKAKVPLTPASVAALEAYLTDRAHRAGLGSPAQLAGPLLATATGGGCGRGTCGSWCAGSPALRASRPGSNCRRTPCGTRRPPSPSTPAQPARRAGLCRAQRSPHDPPLRPRPGQPGPQRRLRGRGLPRVADVCREDVPCRSWPSSACVPWRPLCGSCRRPSRRRRSARRPRTRSRWSARRSLSLSPPTIRGGTSIFRGQRILRNPVTRWALSLSRGGWPLLVRYRDSGVIAIRERIQLFSGGHGPPWANGDLIIFRRCVRPDPGKQVSI